MQLHTAALVVYSGALDPLKEDSAIWYTDIDIDNTRTFFYY